MILSSLGEQMKNIALSVDRMSVFLYHLGVISYFSLKPLDLELLSKAATNISWFLQNELEYPGLFYMYYEPLLLDIDDLENTSCTNCVYINRVSGDSIEVSLNSLDNVNIYLEILYLSKNQCTFTGAASVDSIPLYVSDILPTKQISQCVLHVYLNRSNPRVYIYNIHGRNLVLLNYEGRLPLYCNGNQILGSVGSDFMVPVMYNTKIFRFFNDSLFVFSVKSG